MILNYNIKKEYLLKRQYFLCPIDGISLSGNNNSDLHHKCHNTKWRRKKFPLFLNSLLNLVAVDHLSHMQNPSAFKIHDIQAEKYEKFLERHPKISEWVNNLK